MLKMEAITLEDLTQKLQDAPTSILEKIWDYADALLENKELTFTLSDKQKIILDERLKADKKDFIPAREALNKLRQKYEL